MYKRLPAIVLILSGLLGLAGCDDGDPQVELQNEMIAAMDDIGNTLGSIKDEKSALAAKGKLEALVITMNSLREQSKGLRNPSAEYKAKMMEMQGKVLQFAITSANNPRILEIIGPAMDNLAPR